MYNKTTWKDLDVITKEKLNNIENGIETIDLNLAAVAKSGDYNDLSNTPMSLPANGGNAATVNGHTVNADVPSDAVFTDTTYGVATMEEDGLMSAADKAKLDGLSEDGSDVVVVGTESRLPATGYTSKIYRTENIPANGTFTWDWDRERYERLAKITEVYTKTEIDEMIGDVSSVIDSINGETI